jgi:hypothetical protein
MKFHCGTNQFLWRNPAAINSNESPNTQPIRNRKPSSPSAPKINNTCWAPQGKQRPEIDLRRFGCPFNEVIVEFLVVEGLTHLNGLGMLKTAINTRANHFSYPNCPAARSFQPTKRGQGTASILAIKQVRLKRDPIAGCSSEQHSTL